MAPQPPAADPGAAPAPAAAPGLTAGDPAVGPTLPDTRPASPPVGAAALSSDRPADVVSDPKLDDPQEFARRLNLSGAQSGGDGDAAAASARAAPLSPSVVQSSFGVTDAQREASRDQTRETISLWLIGLLCAIVVLTFSALFARGAATGFGDREFFHELKQVLDVLVAPIITLLASAIGFYFGYKQGESSGAGAAGGGSGSGRRDAQ